MKRKSLNITIHCNKIYWESFLDSTQVVGLSLPKVCRSNIIYCSVGFYNPGVRTFLVLFFESSQGSLNELTLEYIFKFRFLNSMVPMSSLIDYSSCQSVNSSEI